MRRRRVRYTLLKFGLLRIEIVASLHYARKDFIRGIVGRSKPATIVEFVMYRVRPEKFPKTDSLFKPTLTGYEFMSMEMHIN